MTESSLEITSPVTVPSVPHFQFGRQLAKYRLDATAAKEISLMSALLEETGANEITMDYSQIEWMYFSDTDKPAVLSNQQLHISRTEIWFTVRVGNGNFIASTLRQTIVHIEEYFGLSATTMLAAAGKTHEIAESVDLVRQISRFPVWSFSDKAGKMINECEAPGEGYLESHCDLMELIVNARSLVSPLGEPA